MTEDEKLEPNRKTSADPKKVGIRGISCDVCEQLREKKIDGKGKSRNNFKVQAEWMIQIETVLFVKKKVGGVKAQNSTIHSLFLQQISQPLFVKLKMYLLYIIVLCCFSLLVKIRQWPGFEAKAGA